MRQLVPTVVQVLPPGEDVTLYEVTGRPPVEIGGVQATKTAPLAAIARTAVGAPGALGEWTTMPVWVLVRVVVTVSATVTDWVPGVARVTMKVWEPWSAPVNE
jgi:hypothetical protein